MKRMKKIIFLNIINVVKLNKHEHVWRIIYLHHRIMNNLIEISIHPCKFWFLLLKIFLIDLFRTTMKTKTIAKNNKNQTTIVREEISVDKFKWCSFRYHRRRLMKYLNLFSLNLIMIVHHYHDHHYPMKILLFHLMKKIHRV